MAEQPEHMTVLDIAKEVALSRSISLAEAIRLVLDELGLGMPEEASDA